MTLSKQLLGLITALFLMVFSLNFVISVNNIKNYLQIESEIHAQDTATSLGLSLSPYIANQADPILQTMIGAIFDRGYYKEIKLVNSDAKELVNRTNDVETKNVPAWFMRMLPLNTAVAKSEINSGWSIGGVISVSINPGYAYLKLFQQAKMALVYSAVAFVVSVFLLFFVLRFILLPLKNINLLAVKISEGEFDTIEPLPWTLEVRNVANSMNKMSRKISTLIKNLNHKLEELGKKLHEDNVTRLEKKSSFETDMKKLFMENNNAFVFLTKIDGLKAMSKEHDSATIDQFLLECAQTLQQTALEFAEYDIKIYHFFGGDFAILAKGLVVSQAEQIAKAIALALTELGGRYQKHDIAHIGVTAFNPMETTAGTLAAATEAYEQAKLIGANSYYIRVRDEQAKDTAAWKALVFDIIERKSYKIECISPTENFKTGGILMEDAFIKVIDASGELIPIGTFVAIAEKFEKIVELDKDVLGQMLEHLETQGDDASIAVSLSIRTIKNVEFRMWLATKLQQHHKVASRLVFSFSAYAAAKELKLFKEFDAFVHAHGAKIMLKRFETVSMSIEIAKTLKPDYIRIARCLGNGISEDTEKFAFVENMMVVGDLLDINILAENIYSELDFDMIKAIGIAGASR
ncbi:MAG: LapD/MoxY N-terminal periplasmic domain-containing protein [Methylococcaceae bacterium]|jgi:EAL domain-containing protein (putative c-di-GMP-specific phosphodiesterase class I)/GGDEF domain-containing protein